VISYSFLPVAAVFSARADACPFLASWNEGIHGDQVNSYRPSEDAGCDRFGLEPFLVKQVRGRRMLLPSRILHG
jgi:hypothetical protein